jgi:uncharacterized protein YuzB (UPF0349 family)
MNHWLTSSARHWRSTSRSRTTPCIRFRPATALVEGIYQGAVRVGTLREHGDLDIARVDCLTRVNVCLLSAFAETAARHSCGS